MISVCLATYNGEPYIREQVNSILEQLAPGDELVISDDASSDRTLEIVRSFNDSRIKILRNELAKGVSGNFENAMRHAKGDYIFLADQDDMWLPGKVSSCLDELKHCDLVLHDASIVNKDLVPQNKTLFSELKIKEGFVHNFIKNRFTGCCMAFNRSVLSYVSPVPIKSYFLHDNWIGLMVSLKGKISFINRPLILFRRHESNNSTAGSKSALHLSKKILSRLSIGYNIIKRVLIK